MVTRAHPRPPVAAAQRRRDLADIHRALSALGWDDDTYRDVMQATTGVRSSADMSQEQRGAWLAHLHACMRQAGLQVQVSGAARTPAAQRHPWTPRHHRLWAAWQALADAGLLRDRSREALQSWAAGQVQTQQLHWLTAEQLDTLIERSKGWLRSRAEPAPATVPDAPAAGSNQAISTPDA